MKKGLLFTFAAFSVFCLTACDFFGGNGNNSDTGDSTVYGTGGENVTLTVGNEIPAGEYVATFKAPSNQPAGEDPVTAGFVGVYQRSVSAQNMLREDFFETTSMCSLASGQVVNLKYATLQNINSNPKVGALKNGVFKVGVHFKTGTNGTVKVRCLGESSGTFSSTAGQVIFYKKLSDSGYYLDSQNRGAVNNLTVGEQKEFIYVPDNIYVMLNSAEIVTN